MVTDEEERCKSIGRNLQRLRKEAGFKSAKAFAEYVGISTARYTEYEQGRRCFNYDQAWEFADALGCSMDELAGRIYRESDIDPRKEEFGNYFDMLSDKSKDDLIGIASSFSKDPTRTNKIGKIEGDQNA